MKIVFRKLQRTLFLIFFSALLVGYCSNIVVINAAERNDIGTVLSADKKKTTATEKPTQSGATSYDYSWITKGATKSKNFTKYTDNFKIEAGSLVRFLTVVAITVVASSIIIIGMKYTWQKNGQQRREYHNQLITIFLVICAILGLGTILALAQQIGESILK